MPVEVDKFGRKLKLVLKDVRDNPPLPADDWDLIWVLSGPQTTFEEFGDECGNETRDRFITGIGLVKKVAAVQLGKNVEDITQDDLRKCGPKIYFNGTDAMNGAMRSTCQSGIFESVYSFPRELIIVAGNEGITNTPDQLKKFPTNLLIDRRRIVVVTDAYHIPRTRRISKRPVIDNEMNPVPAESLVFHPSYPLRFPISTIIGEIRKIPQLIEKGYLPLED